MRIRVLALVLLAAVTTALARDRRTIAVRMPKIALPAGSNVELCYVARIPATTEFMAGSWQIVHAGAKGSTLPQHGLVYLYTGEHAADLPTGQVVQSRGCLDMPPADRDRRVVVASGSARKTARTMPVGVAVGLAPVPDAPGGAPAAIGILVDVNWRNGETRERTVSTKVVFRRGKKKVARVARPVADHGADADIFVPPFTRRATTDLGESAWRPASDACVLGLSTQMHRHGRCAAVDLLDAQGGVKPPAAGQPNACDPDAGLRLFVGGDWTDPGALAFTTPLAVRAGEALRYACWIDNGVVGGSVRLGCETTPGETPGSVAGGPAPLCSVAVPASAECPGNAACVPANAVAGPTPDDEICGITALVYDAAPGGGCDVSSLP